jgi:trigger factor
VPSTVEQLSPTRVKLTVEVPFADLKPHLDKAYRDIAQQVTIPGFRKGKVPSMVIDQRFGRGMVLQEAINAILPSAYEAAVAESKIVPLGEPEVDVTRLEDGDVVEFTAEVDVRPEFEIPAFSTLSATVDALPATEAAVAERVELLRARFATSTEVDRPAAEGDVVTIDLVGSRDGEPLPDATAEGITYEIGSGGMLDGLDEAVTGLAAGESAEFASTLVGGALEGEPADITVTVTKVSERELPEVDDEFAQLVSEFDTAEEMLADLAASVEAYNRSEQAAKGRDLVLEALVAATDLELPEHLLATEVDARKAQINEQLKNMRINLEDYLERAQDEASTPEEFWAEIESSTEKSLRAQLILDKVADDAEVGVDQADLSELLVRKAAQNNSSPEAEAQHMMEHNHIGAWMQEIRRNKALGLIVADATVTDSEGAAVDVTGRPAEADEDEADEAAEPVGEPAPTAKAKRAAKA